MDTKTEKVETKLEQPVAEQLAEAQAEVKAEAQAEAQAEVKAEEGGNKLEVMLKDGLEEAQKRLQGLESEAGKLVDSLKPRVEESRKELQALLVRLDNGRLEKLAAHPRVKELGHKATETRDSLRKQLEALQARMVEAVGLASQAQVRDIHAELAKLSQKVDTLLEGAASLVAQGAAQVTGKKSAKVASPRV